MTDDEGARAGVGPFLAGLALGAVLGALFAPEAGAKTRTRLGRRVGRLREDWGEVVAELRTVMAADRGGEGEETPRATLQRRLAAARAARAARRPGAGTEAGTTDLPPA